MSLKPKVILTEELADQIQALMIKKDELLLQRDEVAQRLQTIEMVNKENAALAAKTKEQVAESVDLFLEEWKKIPELYPEVRLGILQRTLELITPPPEKKK
jgi:Tfp pilus assembly protein PilN